MINKEKKYRFWNKTVKYDNDDYFEKSCYNVVLQLM